ncbi:MAG: replicative DNA helicase [Pirellulales bacterium]
MSAPRSGKTKREQPAAAPLNDGLFALPSELEAERAVLASVLLSAEVLDDVQLEIDRDDLFDEAHRLIYERMLALYNSGRKLDVTTLVSSLRKERGGGESALDLAGGLEYLTSLLELRPTASGAAYYARLVREASLLRQLQKAAADTLSDVARRPESARDAVGEAERRIFAISEREMRAQDARPIGEAIDAAMAELTARREGVAPGLCSGYRPLDDVTGGLRPGELVVLAARTSMGKTALALNIAEHVSRSEGRPVLYVSLEMSRVSLADRLLGSLARVDSRRLRAGVLTPEERREIVAASSLMHDAPLVVDDAPTRSAREIAALARRLKRREGLGLVVVDYLQLVEPEDRRVPRQEQVAAVSRRMKGMARELGVPVLCLAQLNRQADTGEERPKLSHLRESGAVEQDADVVLFVHRAGYYRQETASAEGQEAEIIVAKQRNGQTGTVKLLWFGPFMRFENPSQRDDWEQGAFF